MPEKEITPKIKFITRLINGAFGGIVGTCCIYPLDFGKTRIQSQSNIISSEIYYRNFIDVIFKEIKRGGFNSIYKGLGVNLLFVMPEKAIKLAVNDQMRSILGCQNGQFNSWLKEIISGSSAGFCQVIITTPMELLKIQMQLSSQVSTITTKKYTATSLAYNLFKNNGILSLYKGISPTILRDVFFSSIYFPLFNYFNSKGLSKSTNIIPFQHTLISGFISGIIAAFLATPFDVIKTRIQSSNTKYTTISDCFTKTIQYDGFQALFRGSTARMAVIAPLFAIAQSVYFLDTY